mmetsp:Transcript_3799/g.8517  ORF Transcript_3799/g.8517 Transcript_3799/m.8517 type:complete len:597 (-) Transcript_3799:624-2414(-)
MSTSSSSQQRQQRRRQRNTASTVATVAVAYGTYRLAQWYWKDDGNNENEEGREHPLEEDLPSSSYAEEEEEQQQQQQQHHQHNRNANTNANQTGDRTATATATLTSTSTSSDYHPRHSSSSKNDSWLSAAVTGVVGWLADTANFVSPISQGIPYNNTTNNNKSATLSARSRHRPTRRQQLIRCRYQTRVAFQTCFSTLQPAIESSTDASHQTKELIVLRRRRQTLLKEKNEQEPKPTENDHADADVDANPNTKSSSFATPVPNEQERKLQQLRRCEDDLWHEILVAITTRMMVSSYAYALLFLSLTVQFHWLAAQADSSEKTQSGSHSFSYSTEQQQQKQEQERQEFLMQSHRYFLKEGLPLLVSTVRKSVEKVCFEDDENEQDVVPNNSSNSSLSRSTWRLENLSTQFVTCEEIEEVLYQRLPHVLEDVGIANRQPHRRGSRRRNWIRFVLPDEEKFDPIWDICRSPVWEDAQEQVLGYLWHEILRDGGKNNTIQKEDDSSHGWGEVFRSGEMINDTYSRSDGRKSKQQEQHQQRRPLVKVMAQFKKAVSALFEDSSSADERDCNRTWSIPDERTTTGRLQMLPTVLELGDITLQ